MPRTIREYYNQASKALKNRENVCNPAIKYKFNHKLGLWVRTWFTIERDPNTLEMYFKQHNAFHKDRKADWKDWTPKAFGNLEAV